MMGSLEKIVKPLLDWYDVCGRSLPWRQKGDAYAIWVSEIMLQQTRVEAVKPYYDRFMAALPDVMALAQASEDALLKLWEGLGYYSRVRNMQKAARILVEEHVGQLPNTVDQLLTLPGIGPYTAGAIASIAYGACEPAVDGNVLRVLARLDNDDGDVLSQAAKTAARQRLLQVIPAGRAGAFNQAMMDLGATVCLPNGQPLCETCPLQRLCLGFRAGRQRDLPVKRKKKERRIEEKTVFVIRSSKGILMGKRPNKGLLASLWELPALPGLLELEQALAQLSHWNLQPVGSLAVGETKHVFTHVQWNMRVYGLDVSDTEAPQGWCYGALDGGQALPSAFRVCLDAVGMGEEKG